MRHTPKTEVNNRTHAIDLDKLAEEVMKEQEAKKAISFFRKRGVTVTVHKK